MNFNNYRQPYFKAGILYVLFGTLAITLIETLYMFLCIQLETFMIVIDILIVFMYGAILRYIATQVIYFTRLSELAVFSKITMVLNVFVVIGYTIGQTINFGSIIYFPFIKYQLLITEFTVGPFELGFVINFICYLAACGVMIMSTRKLKFKLKKGWIKDNGELVEIEVSHLANITETPINKDEIFLNLDSFYRVEVLPILNSKYQAFDVYRFINEEVTYFGIEELVTQETSRHSKKYRANVSANLEESFEASPEQVEILNQVFNLPMRDSELTN